MENKTTNTNVTRLHIIYWFVLFCALCVVIATVQAFNKCDSAWCMLDKQITKENEIKKLQEELKIITKTKEQLYVSWINEGIKQTSGFTKLQTTIVQEQKLWMECQTSNYMGENYHETCPSTLTLSWK